VGAAPARCRGGRRRLPWRAPRRAPARTSAAPAPRHGTACVPPGSAHAAPPAASRACRRRPAAGPVAPCETQPLGAACGGRDTAPPEQRGAGGGTSSAGASGASAPGAGAPGAGSARGSRNAGGAAVAGAPGRSQRRPPPRGALCPAASPSPAGPRLSHLLSAGGCRGRPRACPRPRRSAGPGPRWRRGRGAGPAAQGVRAWPGTRWAPTRGRGHGIGAQDERPPREQQQRWAQRRADAHGGAGQRSPSWQGAQPPACPHS
jgi:hypothetical protein